MDSIPDTLRGWAMLMESLQYPFVTDEVRQDVLAALRSWLATQTLPRMRDPQEINGVTDRTWPVATEDAPLGQRLIHVCACGHPYDKHHRFGTKPDACGICQCRAFDYRSDQAVPDG